MFLRILPLLVLLQCNSVSQKENLLASENLACTYHKYISGAGGGKGIIFRVTIADSISDFSVQNFEVNGITLPSVISYHNGETQIEASKFYARTSEAEGENQKATVDPVLFNDEDFKGVITLLAGSEYFEIELENFVQEIGEDHP